jgi:hypothetical protein
LLRTASGSPCGLEKHLEKAFIRRIERGVDFLGYHFSLKALTAARETLKRFVSRATRLYEQDQESYKTSRQLAGN